LIFAYRWYDHAVHALDALGDDESSAVINKIKTDWEDSGIVPDLSHESLFGLVKIHPNREEIIQACSGLIDAYDEKRISNERVKLNLRKTIDSLFELRSFARQIAINPKNTEQAEKNWSLASPREFPISTVIANKLMAADLKTMEMLKEHDDKTLSALTGLSNRQIEKAHQQIFRFLEYQFKNRISKLEIALTPKLSEITGKPIGFRNSTYFDWLPSNKNRKSTLLGVEFVKILQPHEAWKELLDFEKIFLVFLNDSKSVFSEIEKLQETSVEWTDFPWIPEENTLSPQLQNPSKTNASLFLHQNRSSIAHDLGGYFRQNQLHTLLDVVLHPDSSWKELGAELDRKHSFQGKLSMGLLELKSNILSRTGSERERVEILLRLVTIEMYQDDDF
jgi:hypothetical protein